MDEDNGGGLWQTAAAMPREARLRFLVIVFVATIFVGVVIDGF